MTYVIRHEFPATGEWGEVRVETKEEALRWFLTKTSGACSEKRVVTLTNPKGELTHHYNG